MVRTGPQPRPDTPAVDQLPAGQRARRARIVAAAVELLGTDEYDAIHMRLVAERAGVALGTLYRYFPSKEQLFGAALIQWAHSFQQRYRRTIQPAASDPADQLKQTLRSAVTAFERNPRFFGLVVVLQSSADPVVASLFREFSATTTGVIHDTLEGVEERYREPIETIALAVLFNLLRGWSLGAWSIAEVLDRLDACVDVLFAEPKVSAKGQA